jgi:hypothetical protein
MFPPQARADSKSKVQMFKGLKVEGLKVETASLAG